MDLNSSEAVSVVVMRYRENPRTVIEYVIAKIASLESELGGVKIRGIYDHTFLIDETVHTLSEALMIARLSTHLLKMDFEAKNILLGQAN